MGSMLILLGILLPFAQACLIPLFGRASTGRDIVMLSVAFGLFLVTLGILYQESSGISLELELFKVDGLWPVFFKTEPLGAIFACMASSLWVVNTLYSLGYMEACGEKCQTRFYSCFALSMGAVLIIALAGNLFTLFLGYELLTVATYPLVTHKMNLAAMRAGRVYAGLLIFVSMVFFLPAILWTASLAGTLDFTPGGILAGKIAPFSLLILLLLFLFGVGKAALMPFHFWLPAAMVAPAPVSALLHAVAVVKTGVFTLLKIAVYVFGIDLLVSIPLLDWVIGFTALTVILSSLIALTKNDLKERLAYSTVGQLGYIILAAESGSALSIMGGGLHLLAHAFGKITLFFCAGAIYIASGRTAVSQLDGLGRAMPFTFAAFLLAALSIVGFPPFGGLWGKWFLMLGAVETGHILVVSVLVISSILSALYLLPPALRAFFCCRVGETIPTDVRAVPLPCLIAIALSSMGCILLFFWSSPVLNILSKIVFREEGAI